MIDQLLATNLVPDFLIRIGIRSLLAQKLREENHGDCESNQAALMAHVEGLRESPIAIETRAANEQHYEVPTTFFQLCLGNRLKYSCGFWEPGDTLNSSEERMLALTCQRAQLEDGQRILELGCGWGSLSLWMASQYPKAIITVVSNSATQKSYIDSQASRLGLLNLNVITCDMNRFDTSETFDRVVSVEMFEHMKNYGKLMANVSRWLAPGGKLFVHIFTHSKVAYHFVDKGPTDWMTRYFFSGGQMPSDDLLLYFQDDLSIQEHWNVSGLHYQKTAEAWLANMDAHRDQILPLFERTYGSGQSKRWWVYWRVFFMSCAELWGFRGGNEWVVSHYLFKKKTA